MAIPSVYICMLLCGLDIHSMKHICQNSICQSAEKTIWTYDLRSSKTVELHHILLDDQEQKGIIHHQTTSKQNSSDPENCCDDMTSSVLESLISLEVQLPSLEAKLFFIFGINISEINDSCLNILSELFTFYSDSSPPTGV